MSKIGEARGLALQLARERVSRPLWRPAMRRAHGVCVLWEVGMEWAPGRARQPTLPSGADWGWLLPNFSSWAFWEGASQLRSDEIF